MSFAEYDNVGASSDILKQISNLAKDRNTQAQVVQEAEENLKKEKERLRFIDEEQLPELMDQAGMAKFTTDDGLQVEVADKINASIPKPNQPKAFAWLRENGFGDLIKHTVAAKFAMEEDEAAQEAVQTLVDMGCDVDDLQSVHPSSLSAFVREQLAAGEELPQDLLGVRRIRIAKVK